MYCELTKMRQILLIAWMSFVSILANAFSRDVRDEQAGISFQSPFDQFQVKRERQLLALAQAEGLGSKLPQSFVPSTAVYDRDSSRYLVVWYSSDRQASTMLRAVFGDAYQVLGGSKLIYKKKDGVSVRWVVVQRLAAGEAVSIWYGDGITEPMVTAFAQSLAPLSGYEPDLVTKTSKYNKLLAMVSIAVTSSIFAVLALYFRRQRLPKLPRDTAQQTLPKYPAVRR